MRSLFSFGSAILILCLLLSCDPSKLDGALQMGDNLEVAPGQAPPGTAPQPPATAPLEEDGEGDDEGSGRPISPKTIFRKPPPTLETIPPSGDVAPCFAFELRREGEEPVPHVVFEEAAGDDRRLVFATKREGNWSTEMIASEEIPSPPPTEPCAFRPAIYIDRRGVTYVAYRTDGSHLALAMKRRGGSWEVEDDIVGTEVGPDFAIGAADRTGGRYQLYFRVGRRLAGFVGDTGGHSRLQFFGGEPGDRVAIAYDKPYPFPVQHLQRFGNTIASEERPWRLDFPAGKDFDIVPHPRSNAQSYAIVPEASPSAALHLIEFRREGSIAERDIDAAGRYPSIDATPELRFFISYSHEGKLWVAGGEQSGPWSKRVVLNSGDPATEFRSAIKADGNTLHIVFHNGASKTLQYLPRSTF